MSSERYEIVVVGGGVIGGSVAYHAVRQGRRVLLVERAEVAVAPAASWASAGGVRRQGRHPAEAALAVEAIARWPDLEAELEADLAYRRGGNLLLAEGDDEAAGLAAFVERQRALGFDGVRLVDRAECLALVPGLGAGVSAGSYSPDDGQAVPPSTARAFVAAAVRHGAACWTGTACHGLLARGDRVLGVRTDRGEVGAEVVVLAAGAWSDELAAGVGLRLPIRTLALQMVLTVPAPPDLLRPVLGSVGRPLSLKQLRDGAFLIGGGWLGVPGPDRRDYTLMPERVRGNWETARALLPAVGERAVARAWCGLEAESIDGIPFVGVVPGLDGLALAAGFSGHGFALAPAVGRALADRLAGRPAPELDGLRPERIFDLDAATVAAFLTREDDGPAAAG